jgi:hypothetical protein
MTRRKLFFLIILVNLIIPFFFVNANELLTRLFNPAVVESLAERVLHSFRPLIMLLFLVAGSLFSIIIYRLLIPFFKCLEGDRTRTVYRKARLAAIRLPLLIIFLHTALWALGTVVFFLINNWQAPGGVPFLWSLLLNTGNGLHSAVFAALAINILLLPAKQELKMSDIRRGEKDFFVRNKFLFICLGTGFYYFLIAAYAARFFMLLASGALFQPGLEPSFVFLGAGFLVEAAVLLFLAGLENRRQIRFIKEKLEFLARGEGDLTAHIHLLHFDEIGELCVTINRLIGFLAGLIGNVKRSADLSLATGGTLERVTGETEARFTALRGELELIIGSVGRRPNRCANWRGCSRSSAGNRRRSKASPRRSAPSSANRKRRPDFPGRSNNRPACSAARRPRTRTRFPRSASSWAIWRRRSTMSARRPG